MIRQFGYLSSREIYAGIQAYAMRGNNVIAAVFILTCTLIYFIMISAPVYADAISVSSTNGDRVSVMGNIYVNEETDGDVVSVIGDAQVDQNVDGDVVVVFGDVTINARVSGDVVCIFGTARLTDKAEIGRSLVLLGNAEKTDGARVHGEEISIYGDELNIDIHSILLFRVMLIIASTIIILLVGLAMIAVSRQKFNDISASVDYDIGRKFAIGFLGFLAFTIISILLFVTVIIPIFYFIVLLIGAVVSSIYFGKMILKTFSSEHNVYMEFITGLITCTLIKVSLIYLIPSGDILLNGLVYIMLSVFVNSIGIGILIDLLARSGKPKAYAKPT